MDINKITLKFVFLGVLSIILGIPLSLSKIKPNGVYGFRTSKTLSDPQIWYAVNRIGGIDFCISGIAVILGSLLFRVILKSYRPSVIYLANIFLFIFATAMVLTHFFIVLSRY
jgi:uncharacterized membrane protein